MIGTLRQCAPHISVAGSLLDATCNNLRNRLLRRITIKSKLLNMCVSNPGKTCNISSIDAPQILTMFPFYKPGHQLRNDLVDKLTDRSI